MRRVVPAVGLGALAVAMSVSACASSSSLGSAASAGSMLALSSPAAGSASASAIQVSSPAPACPPVDGWPNGSRSPAPTGQLFVAGSPTLATLCQYVTFSANGSSLPPPVLVQITGPVLTDLVASLNALVPTNDEPPCAAPARTDVLVFVGAGSPSMVRLDLEGGCNFVWSDTGVHAYATNQLLQQLAAIAANAPGSASPVCTGFALSLVSDRGGQPSPIAAAVWFAEHGSVPGTPLAGWEEVSRGHAEAKVASGTDVLHVIEGPDGTWQVDSGQSCP